MKEVWGFKFGVWSCWNLKRKTLHAKLLILAS